jgi:hypothetical protein
MSLPLHAVPEPRKPREPVLDTVERVSEMCFGLFMALTFVGMVSATQDPGIADPARAMFVAALGCNLAWGLVDAVMYLVRTVTDRGKRLTLAALVRKASPATAIDALRSALQPGLRSLVTATELEAIRSRLAEHELPDRPRLHADDYLGAITSARWASSSSWSRPRSRWRSPSCCSTTPGSRSSSPASSRWRCSSAGDSPSGVTRDTAASGPASA